MKKTITFLLFLFMIVTISAQHNKQVNREQLLRFIKSTTYVVMDPNPLLGYNFTIKTAMDKFWTVTPYKYISTDEFENLRMNRNNSFIILTKVSVTKDKSDAQYLYFNFLMGDSVKEINDMPEILELPLCYTGVDENSYVYKMGVIVRFAQEHVKMLMTTNFLWTYRNLTYYNLDVREIKRKVLLVEASDLAEEVNTIDKIKTVYPYPIRIVSSDEITNAVNKQTPNTLILHVVSPVKVEAWVDPTKLFME